MTAADPDVAAIRARAKREPAPMRTRLTPDEITRAGKMLATMFKNATNNGVGGDQRFRVLADWHATGESLLLQQLSQAREDRRALLDTIDTLRAQHAAALALADEKAHHVLVADLRAALGHTTNGDTHG